MADQNLSDREFLSKISVIVGSGVVICGIVAFIYRNLSSSSNSSMSEAAAAAESPVNGIEFALDNHFHTFPLSLIQTM